MKVSDLFEIDEWENNPETLLHLNKVQKARTQECWNYLQFLEKKYNDNHLTGGVSANMWINSTANALKSMSSLLKYLKPLPAETSKYSVLFDRMIKAKQAYDKQAYEEIEAGEKHK